MTPPRHLQVLLEDNHLLVVNKPAGLATMGVEAGQPSLVTQCKEYLKRKYDKPGNVYLGVVSRLDAQVAGVVVFARTSKAAARLCEQFRNRDVLKEYWSIVAGLVTAGAFQWQDWIARNEALQRMEVVAPNTPGATLAVLSGTRLAVNRDTTLLSVQPTTGRKHQIRVQCAYRSHPILGDRKYGSRHAFPQGIGLFSRRLQFAHPVRHTPCDVVAAIPAAWRTWTQDVAPPS